MGNQRQRAKDILWVNRCERYIYIVSPLEYTMVEKTIKVSDNTKNDLDKAKAHPRETYDDVISRNLLGGTAGSGSWSYMKDGLFVMGYGSNTEENMRHFEKVAIQREKREKASLEEFRKLRAGEEIVIKESDGKPEFAKHRERLEANA